MKRRNSGFPAPPPADGVRPVIWTVSVSRLSRLLQDVTPEFDTRADIENIHLGFDEAVTTRAPTAPISRTGSTRRWCWSVPTVST